MVQRRLLLPASAHAHIRELIPGFGLGAEVTEKVAGVVHAFWMALVLAGRGGSGGGGGGGGGEVVLIGDAGYNRLFRLRL